jgi:hypothetical protein
MEKDQDAFAEAVQAQGLRQEITQHAAAAVRYGHIDRNWVNTWLIRLGAEPVAGGAKYQINVPVTGVFGKTVHASTRAEALEKFNQEVARVGAAGQITDGHCDGVYDVAFNGETPTFFSGPEDLPEQGTVPGLDALKNDIRQMLKQGVSEQGWGHSYAVAALASMGLAPLPALVHKTVHVPVGGVARLDVNVFEGDDDETVQSAAAGVMARSKQVTITPDEIGIVMSARPGGDMGLTLTLVDEDDEDGAPKNEDY